MDTSHYPSLELCKKLTEIGFPKTALQLKDTRKSWKEYNCNKYGDFIAWEGIKIGDIDLEISESGVDGRSCYNNSEPLVYPSTMEMLDVIPIEIYEGEKDYYFHCGHKFAEYLYTQYEDEYKLYFIYNIHIPDALAEMIIWLHENKYISFSK